MRRCLIVANQTLSGPHLLAEVLARQASEEYDFYIVVPASHAHTTAPWTEGQANARARDALTQALEHFRSEGIEAIGEVGDQNPVLAVADVLSRREIDEIIVSTLPPGASKWLKKDLPRRIAKRFELPVTHVVATTQHVS